MHNRTEFSATSALLGELAMRYELDAFNVDERSARYTRAAELLLETLGWTAQEYAHQSVLDMRAMWNQSQAVTNGNWSTSGVTTNSGWQISTTTTSLPITYTATTGITSMPSVSSVTLSGLTGQSTAIKI